MLRFIAKTVGGILLGMFVYCSVYASAPSAALLILMLLWGIGIVQAFPSQIRMMKGLLTSALQLSVISWLSFGTGILGFLLLLIVVIFNLTIGWVYGIYLFIVDLKSVL